ncbi:hypothetical protein [Bradyrhizobium sp. STM 3562]|uniref:hypothetical protein n=1 Tax=Bradyrhizobium sp. STM 3562 TaxID=578924 RepID=UPI00388F7D91
MRTPDRELTPRISPELIALYKRRARRLWIEACRRMWRAVWWSLTGYAARH